MTPLTTAALILFILLLVAALCLYGVTRRARLRRQTRRENAIAERDLQAYWQRVAPAYVPLSEIPLEGMWPNLRYVTCGGCSARSEHDAARRAGWQHSLARPTVYKCAACLKKVAA